MNDLFSNHKKQLQISQIWTTVLQPALSKTKALNLFVLITLQRLFLSFNSPVWFRNLRTVFSQWQERPFTSSGSSLSKSSVQIVYYWNNFCVMLFTWTSPLLLLIENALMVTAWYNVLGRGELFLIKSKSPMFSSKTFYSGRWKTLFN